MEKSIIAKHQLNLLEEQRFKKRMSELMIGEDSEQRHSCILLLGMENGTALWGTVWQVLPIWQLRFQVFIQLA